MKKELKGLDSKVAIHCTTPEEKQIVGQMLVDGVDMSPASIEKALIEDFPICYSIWGSFWGWEYPNWTERNGYTIISAAQFIAMNTEPEAAPAWSFKTDEELAEMMIAYHDQIPSKRKSALDFLSSLRKPAFELITADNVKVTDPEQPIFCYYQGHDGNWKVNEQPAAAATRTEGWFSTEQAAVEHRLHNTPAIKLSDMTYDAESESYCIGLNAAHNLVNERIK